MDLTAIFLIQIVVTIAFAAAAAIFDVKRNFVPDELNWALIVFGLSSNLILSLLSADIKYISASIISMVVTYAVAYMLWKLKMWAGGDAKLFTSIATAIPFGINMNFLSIYPTLSVYPFSFSVMVNSILSSFPVLVIFLSYVVIKKDTFNRNIDFLFNIFSISSLKVFFELNLNYMVPIKDLKEGMILNNYYFNDERIKELISEEQSNLEVYKSSDDEYEYYFKSETAGGITNRDMFLLKIMEAQDMISKDASVKLSYPFTPSILCGLIITIFFGDLIMLFTKNLFVVV